MILHLFIYLCRISSQNQSFSSPQCFPQHLQYCIPLEYRSQFVEISRHWPCLPADHFPHQVDLFAKQTFLPRELLLPCCTPHLSSVEVTAFGHKSTPEAISNLSWTSFHCRYQYPHLGSHFYHRAAHSLVSQNQQTTC